MVEGEQETGVAASVDEYIQALPPEERAELQRIRGIIKATVPQCRERIAYRICVFSLRRDMVGLACHKQFCSLYTMSPGIANELEKELKGHEVVGTTIHFTPDRPLPTALIRKILKARVRELS